MLSNNERDVAALVQRYRHDNCTAEERAFIEANADLLARATAICDGASGEELLADDRPSPQDLIAYVDGTLDAARRQFVEDCSERMPEIRAEIRLLRRLGNNPLMSE